MFAYRMKPQYFHTMEHNFYIEIDLYAILHDTGSMQIRVK